MKLSDWTRLILLAAIWGSSFIFMRLVSPVLGPAITAGSRLFLAGAVLTLYCWSRNLNVDFKKNWKEFLIIGAVSSAFPFLCYAFASLYIPAGYSSILNSMTPLFGALFSALWLNEKFTAKKMLGLFMGTLGVAFITGVGTVEMSGLFLLSVCACLVATICYAISGIYVKKKASHIKPLVIASGSQLVASLVLLPFLPFSPLRGEISGFIVVNLICLSLLCSAVAYLLYYRLLADVGPTKSYTVTFIIPIFGMLWAYLFLGEMITLPMVFGCAFIILGTRFVVKV